MNHDNENQGIVSVIIPVYNAEAYLNQCLESIVRQDYPFLEVLVIDDGSTDSSYDIAMSFANRDERFKVYRQSNAGSSAARNKGLAMATGQYIAFVDADDWVEPDFISTLILNLRRSDADVSMCNFESEGCVEYSWADKLMTSTEEIFREYIHGGCCNRIPNKLYKADLVKSVSFPVGRDLVEDGVWTPSVLRKAERLYRSSTAKYHIRLVENSITRTKKIKSQKKMCGYFANLIDRHTIFYEVLKDEESRHLNTCKLWETLDLILSTWCDLTIWGIDQKVYHLFTEYHDEIYNTADNIQQKIMDCILADLPMKKVMSVYVKEKLKAPIKIDQKWKYIERYLISVMRPA